MDLTDIMGRAGGPGTSKPDLEWLDDKLKTLLADRSLP